MLALSHMGFPLRPSVELSGSVGECFSVSCDNVHLLVIYPESCFKGVLDFIPLMRYSYNTVPAKLFAMVGYTMFAYLFSWTDANWCGIMSLVLGYEVTDDIMQAEA